MKHALILLISKNKPQQSVTFIIHFLSHLLRIITTTLQIIRFEVRTGDFKHKYCIFVSQLGLITLCFILLKYFFCMFNC